MNQEAVLACCVVCEVKTNSRCSRCRNIYYCSTEHQRQDWKRHKIQCVKLPKKHDRKIAVDGVDVEGARKKEVQIVDRSVNQNNSLPPPRQREIDKKSFAAVPNANLCETSDKKVLTTSVENSISNKVFEESATISKKTNTPGHSIKDKSVRLSENSVISSVVHTDKDSSDVGAITYEGSSENEILSASTQQISSTDLSNANLEQNYSGAQVNMLAMSEYSVEAPPNAGHGHKEYPEVNLKGSVEQFCQNHNLFDSHDPYYILCDRVIQDMSRYGVCVLDNFLGKERGTLVLKEVLEMYKQGIFQAGQLVSNPASTKAKTIRSDRITWIDGKEPHCFYIGNLIQQVDNIILRANKMVGNGKMGDYIINGRTKAMVACYPGSGSHYVKHVDNPNKDGRCITAIYYLNLNWDVTKSGGLLRVFPEGHHQVADIAPVFDRMLFFWSDRRNPHEVQPAFDTRYAITLWYFDAQEREEATRRFRDKYIMTPSTSK